MELLALAGGCEDNREFLVILVQVSGFDDEGIFDGGLEGMISGWTGWKLDKDVEVWGSDSFLDCEVVKLIFGWILIGWLGRYSVAFLAGGLIWVFVEETSEVLMKVLYWGESMLRGQCWEELDAEYEEFFMLLIFSDWVVELDSLDGLRVEHSSCESFESILCNKNTFDTKYK